MAQDGVLQYGDQLIGYTERNAYIYWDINPDLQNEKNVIIEQPFFRLDTWRYADYNEIAYLYMTRWAEVVRAYQPITERGLALNYKLVSYSTRYIYVYQDTRERIIFTEGLYTTTPLILKYPKYYNWNYIPQIINPEFRVWSYYEIDKDNITILIMSSGGTKILLNSGVDKDKFKIEKIAEKEYKITCYVDHIFENGETVTCYVIMYDEKGNILKPGFW